MHDSGMLFEVILLLALAAGGLALVERLRLPAVIGFLTVGAIAGPGGLGAVSEPERVQALAEFGVVFLLFEIGLELPIERVRGLWKSALWAGGTQMAVTAGLVGGGALLFGMPAPVAWVVGAGVAMSSTALVMRLLADDLQIDAPHGQLAVAILLFQDLMIVPLLLLVPLVSGDASGGLASVALSIGRMVLALFFLVFVVRFGVPRLLDRVAQQGSADLFSLLALLIVLGSAFAAEELGLTLAVGAFFAGVAASASPFASQLFSEVVPLRGVLLGMFFTAVGMLFDPRQALALAPQVVGFVSVAVLGKALVVALAAVLLLGRSIRVGVLSGLALGQTGEFTFVLAGVAAAAGLLPDREHQILIAGSIGSLLVSPFLIRAGPTIADAIADRFDRFAVEDGSDDRPHAEADARGRVVVIGFGVAGQTLARLLRAIDVPYLILDTNAKAVTAAGERGEPILFGDATRPIVLGRLGIAHARLVVVAISDTHATRRIVSRLRALSPETPVLARTRYVRDVDPLSERGAHRVVADEFEGSIEVVAHALELFEVPAGAIQRFTAALREEGYGAIRGPAGMPLDPWLVELLEETETSWLDVPETFPRGLSIETLHIRSRTGASILAVERSGQTISNPGAEFEIEPEDRLLALGDGPVLAALGALLREYAQVTLPSS